MDRAHTPIADVLGAVSWKVRTHHHLHEVRTTGQLSPLSLHVGEIERRVDEKNGLELHTRVVGKRRRGCGREITARRIAANRDASSVAGVSVNVLCDPSHGTNTVFEARREWKLWSEPITHVHHHVTC